MFDYEAPVEKKRADWSGTIIGLLLMPLFITFMYFGQAELGFNVFIGLGVAAVAARLRWQLRRHAWFWGAVIVALAVQAPFVFVIHWPYTNVPTVVYAIPIGLCSYALTAGAIAIAEKIFSSDDASGDERG